MPLINITKLNKAEVALALFNNACQSPSSLQTKEKLLSLSSPILGLYRPLKLYQIESEFKRTASVIDYLGCVKFSMDFCKDSIDMDVYDVTHCIRINGV